VAAAVAGVAEAAVAAEAADVALVAEAAARHGEHAAGARPGRFLITSIAKVVLAGSAKNRPGLSMSCFLYSRPVRPLRMTARWIARLSRKRAGAEKKFRGSENSPSDQGVLGKVRVLMS
jgi:hypothetical protein